MLQTSDEETFAIIPTRDQPEILVDPSNCHLFIHCYYFHAEVYYLWTRRFHNFTSMFFPSNDSKKLQAELHKFVCCVCREMPTFVCPWLSAGGKITQKPIISCTHAALLCFINPDGKRLTENMFCPITTTEASFLVNKHAENSKMKLKFARIFLHLIIKVHPPPCTAYPVSFPYQIAPPLQLAQGLLMQWCTTCSLPPTQYIWPTVFLSSLTQEATHYALCAEKLWVSWSWLYWG